MSRPHANESVFRAIADPTRRRIIEVLRKGERSVIDLAKALGRNLPNLSHHLTVLRTAGVVHQRRVGRSRMYQLDAGMLRGAAAWLRAIE